MRFNRVPLAEALDEVLSAELDVQAEPMPAAGDLGARELIAELRALVPSGDWARTVADMAGVDRRTIQRIAAGTSGGSKPAVGKLRSAFNDQRRAVESRRRKEARDRRDKAKKKLTAPRGALSIKGTVAVSDDERPRTIDAGPYLKGSARAAIIAAWESGGGDEAAAVLQDALNNDYAAGIVITEVEELKWES